MLTQGRQHEKIGEFNFEIQASNLLTCNRTNILRNLLGADN